MNNPVERLGMLLAMTLDARAATERYMQVIDTASTVQDPDQPVELPDAPEGSVVELVGVGFAHPGATGTPVLDGVDRRL